MGKRVIDEATLISLGDSVRELVGGTDRLSPAAMIQSIHAASEADIIRTAEGTCITLDDSATRKLRGLTLYGKTTQNGTPSPTAPVALESVGDDGSVDVHVCGKNLLPITATSQINSGVSFTINADGSITANGTATGDLWFALNRNVVLPNGNYILSGCRGGAGDTYALYVDVDGNNTFCMTKEVNFTYADALTVKVVILVKSGTTVSETFYPMIRKATVTDATYEPYTAQTMTVQTPNGLPGIPVTSGGNYTDASGQQWICDEIDFVKGKYIQRVKTRTFTGNENLVKASSGNRFYIDYRNNYELGIDGYMFCGGYCSHYPTYVGDTTTGKWYIHAHYGNGGNVRRHMFVDDDYTDLESFKAHLAELYQTGNPVTVMDALTSPIETDLSADELASYASLHTNYPNTTIFNDAGAHMAVKYAADAGAYTWTEINEAYTEGVNSI